MAWPPMASGSAYCPRCGWRGLTDADLCPQCFDGSADAGRAARIVAAARAGSRDARSMLRAIADARALGAVLDAVGDPGLRDSALLSLGYIGDRSQAPIAAALLGDANGDVRRTAIACLAELGPSTADAIATRLEVPEDREAAAIALAWLRDPRGVRPLADLVEGESLVRMATGVIGPHDPISALAWLDDPAASRALEALVERLGPEATAGAPPWVPRSVALKVWSALREHRDPRSVALLGRLAERMADPWLVSTPVERVRAPADPRRSVPRWAMSLRSVEVPVTDPVTKVGGQPVWREVSAWPLAADGDPMVFFAQFAVPWADQTAYLFIDLVDIGATIVCQPGPPAEPSDALTVGPVMPAEVTDRTRFVPAWPYRFVESRVEFESGLDPVDWRALDDADELLTDNRDWNKVGGTPNWLQGPEAPSEPGWRSLFQFTATDMGRELGDGAEVYGFVHDDGRGWGTIQGH